MNATEREARSCARLALAMIACLCILNGGCLIISCDWGGRKKDAPAICHSHAVETFDTDSATIRQACHHAVRGMNMTVSGDTNADGINTIQVVNKSNEKVAIEIQSESPATKPGMRTVVNVRMTTNGTGEESRQILRQIEAFVAGTSVASTQSPGPVVLPVSGTEPQQP